MERIPALDGLRGVAILLVLFFHTTVVRSGTPAEALLHGAFRNFGWTGVDLFFVLSGFLITGILYDARGQRHYFRNFYARRALRIFPVYYAYLILVFGVVPRLHAPASALLPAGAEAASYWLYLQNFWVAAAGEWPHSRLFNLFWSLAVEEHFYLLWPWLVWGCRRRRLVWICTAVLVASPLLRGALLAAGAAPLSAYVLTPLRLDGLAAGALVALLARGPGGLPRFAGAARGLGWASGLGLCALTLWQRGFSFLLPGTAVLGLSLLAVLFAAALLRVLVADPDRGLPRLLAGRTLRAFGRTSYALYVIHQGVFVVTSWLWIRFVVEPHLPGAGPIAIQLGIYGLSIGASFALASASWAWFERPILGLKRHFPRPGRGGGYRDSRKLA